VASEQMDLRSLLAGEAKIDAVIVINAAPLPKCLPSLWSSASLRLCADGGADLLLKAFGTLLKPDLILGDLDSLTDTGRRVWEAEGVAIEREEDQDSTDLGKCLRRVPVNPNGLIVVAGGVGGRLDQTLGVINSIFKEVTQLGRQAIILGGETVACIVSPGEVHRLRFPGSFIGCHCGLVPLFGPCERVTTRGLRWELTDQASSFGGLVSTSNLLASEDLEIVTSHPLLWTISSDDL